MSISNRIKRLEKGKSEFFEIEQLISQGTYFDEISLDLQILYDKYRGIPMSAYVDVMRCFDADVVYPPHIKLEKNPPPPTAEEFEKSLEEVQQAIQKARLKLGL